MQNLKFNFKRLLDSWLKIFLAVLVHGYKLVFSSFLGGNCRFYPSCSDYALSAINETSSWRAFRLISTRLLACHPFGRSGYDPIPTERESKCQ